MVRVGASATALDSSRVHGLRHPLLTSHLKLLCFHLCFFFFDFLGAKIVKELFVILVGAQIFKFLVNLALKGSTLVIDCPQLHRLVVALLLKSLKLCSRFTGLFLDVSEELEEVLGVFLEHLLRADKTELAHLIEIGQTFNFLIFLLEEHLNEEHLSLFLDQVPTVFPVLRTLNWHIETSCLGDVDLVSDVWVDGEGGRLNICFTEFSEAAFSRRPVFLPNLELLVCLTFAFLSSALLILESEDAVITRVCEWVWVLFEAEEGLSALAAPIATMVLPCSAASIQTGSTVAHIITHLNSN